MSLLLIIAGCNPARRISEGQYLLTKNIIIKNYPAKKSAAVNVIEKNSRVLIKNIESDEIENYIKQKPNTKMLGLFRFHLAVYNIATRKERKERVHGKIDLAQHEIETKIKKIVGETPVILDTLMTQRSVNQIDLFLHNSGYFNASVRDSVVLNKKPLSKGGGKAKVYYILGFAERYAIRNISYVIDEPDIRIILDSDVRNSLIKPGIYFEENVLNQERSRIVKKLRNEGYYFFNTDFITFNADSSVGNHLVDITLTVARIKNAVPNDSSFEEMQRKYIIDNVYIQTNFYPNQISPDLDTLKYAEYHIICEKAGTGIKKDRDDFIKFKTIARKVFIRPGDLYKIDNFENTYKHLASLQIFKFINIQFTKSAPPQTGLNCTIQLTPVPSQSFLVEAEGTNSSGSLGIAGNLIYSNKNFLKGAEMLEIKLKGGLEAQKIFTTSNENPIDPLKVFNTIELGPETKFYIPKLLFPVKESRIPKRFNPITTLSAAYNFQQRSDYTRYITNISFGYEWKESAYKTHILNPIDLSAVYLDDRSRILDSVITNAFIRNSFTNHFTTATKYSFIYSNQELHKKVSFSYFRANIEVAGNLLRAASRFFNSPLDTTNNSYLIFGIKYAQYIRIDMDWRRYIYLNRHSTLAMRFLSGLGLPYKNSSAMPFERSFFSGGANDMRAWQARNLGAGSFQGPAKFDQIGDIKLGANLESRFEFIGVFEGAAFIDAGNIWLTHEDPARPGAKFEIDKFYNEIALDAGLGLRLNYNYFILRLDAAIPITNPAVDSGNRWVVQKTSFTDINYNLAIGYPF